MKAKIRHIPLAQLVPHPDNPNRMSRTHFAKLMRHIKQTDCYEPLVVRPHPQQAGCFQIINGHHRYEALQRLEHATAQAVVWNVDDEQTDILLTTLNRLGGRDILERKLAILRRLSTQHTARELAKLLPQTKGQIERLIASRPLPRIRRKQADEFAIPLVFFVKASQQRTIEQALTAATPSDVTTRAARRAAALTDVARLFLEQIEPETDPS